MGRSLSRYMGLVSRAPHALCALRSSSCSQCMENPEVRFSALSTHPSARERASFENGSMSSDRYLIAITQYLTNRHDIALRLLAECHKDVPQDDLQRENGLRDTALAAMVARDYQSAQRATVQLVDMKARRERSAVLRKQLGVECDRLCSARAIIEKREELLDQAPGNIQCAPTPRLQRTHQSTPVRPAQPHPSAGLPWCRDPYMGGVGAYLHKRHDITLRLVAAVDAELACVEAGGAAALELQQRRSRFRLELDALLAALQAHEVKDEMRAQNPHPYFPPLLAAAHAAAHAAARRSGGPPACSGLAPRPETSALAAWLPRRGCGDALSAGPMEVADLRTRSLRSHGV